MQQAKGIRATKTYSIVIVGFFAALTVVFSQISFPINAVPINLALIAVFTSAGLLGFAKGVLSQVIFVLLGAVGLPVFAGFKGGIGALLGPTGGYIIGFVFVAAIVGGTVKIFGQKLVPLVISMVIGLAVCYLFGTLWFTVISGKGFIEALMVCVVPFILFDLAKIALSTFLVLKLKRFV